MKKKIIKNFICALVISFASITTSAQEAMLAEVKLFAGNFAPRGWAFCQGQLLSISQNTALFSLLGTTYGGDGRTTFALLDLHGKVPAGVGNGPGLSNMQLGAKKGSETFTLTIAQMPSHAHALTGVNEMNFKSNPNDKSYTKALFAANTPASTPITNLNTQATGGSQSVNNMQPSLGLNYIICMQGIFPSGN